MPQEPIPFVQRITRPSGKVDLYFRKDGYRERLYSPDDSEELRGEVQTILDKLGRAERAQRPRIGTVAGMIRAYVGDPDAKPRLPASADFLALGRGTQKEYARLADELIDVAGDTLLDDVTPAWVKELRDIWAERGHRAANCRLTVLANALAPAIEDDRIKVDPFGKVKRAKAPQGKGEPHPVWEDYEVAAAIEEALRRKRPGLARAIGLGRWGGFRRGTICAIPRHAVTQGYNPQGELENRLVWITEKRRVLCDKRADPRLMALLASTPGTAWTIAYNANGEAWKERQLNQAIDRLMASLAKAGKVRAVAGDDGEIYSPLTIHGLRHSRGVELAEAGASDAEIMSQLEHATDRAAKIYRRQADRKKLADAAQARVDNVVAIRERARRANPGERTR